MPFTGHSITYRYADSTAGAERTVDVHATPEELQHFSEQGYFLRKALFDATEVAQLREALEVVAEREREQGNAGSENPQFGGQFIRHLYDKHPLFIEYLNHPPLASVARALFGPAVQTRLSARITDPKQKNQQTEWHYHQPLVLPNPAPPFAHFPHSLDVLVYLDDLTEATGPVALVPRSHLRREPLVSNDHEDKPDQQLLFLSAGDALFIHNNLWHRGFPTRPDGTRRRLLAFSYSPAWVKNVNDGQPPEDGLTRALHNSTDREIRELIGLESYR